MTIRARLRALSLLLGASAIIGGATSGQAIASRRHRVGDRERHIPRPAVRGQKQPCRPAHSQTEALVP